MSRFRRSSAFVCASLFSLSGCSSARYSTQPGAPTLVMPARFAEGENPNAEGTSSASRSPKAASAAEPAAAAAPSLTPSKQPDPTPLRLAEQVEYELELREGKVHVVSVKPVKLRQPIVTPRRMGRYAIELGIGQELIERLRFDFPATAADDPQIGPEAKLHAPLTLAERAVVRVKLLVPQSPRVRRALLVDRAYNTATELEWPLPVPPAAGSAATVTPATPVGAASEPAVTPAGAAATPVTPTAATTKPAMPVTPAAATAKPATPAPATPVTSATPVTE